MVLCQIIRCMTNKIMGQISNREQDNADRADLSIHPRHTKHSSLHLRLAKHLQNEKGPISIGMFFTLGKITASLTQDHQHENI